MVGLAGKRAMLLDMTSDSARPLVGAEQGDMFATAGSIAKLGLAFAAYALLEEAQQASTTIADREPAKLWSDIKRRWKSAAAPEVRALAASRAPVFERIFDVERYAATGSVWFASGRRDPLHPSEHPTAALTWAELSDLHSQGSSQVQKELPWLGFGDRLRGMLRESDNEMASACARELGFAYTSTLLRHVGLATDHGGLWQGAEYGHGAGGAYPVRAYGQHPLLGIKHGGTVRAIGTLLALAEQGSLGTTGHDILEAIGPGGPLEQGVATIANTVTAVDKIGIVGAWYGDAAVIKLTAANGRKLRLVLVALDSPDHETLVHLGKELTSRLLACRPLDGWLKNFRLTPSYPRGGEPVHGSLDLRQPAADGGLRVTIAFTQPASVVSTPAIDIPAGALNHTFEITTQPVDVDTPFQVIVSTSLPRDSVVGGGTVRASAVSAVLIPRRTQGGKKGNKGQIVLTGRAGPTTKVVFGPASPPISRLPGTVEVPFGATQVDFTYDTESVVTDRQADIHAMLNGSIITAWTTVVPS
jgi:hypothetical protein